MDVFTINLCCIAIVNTSTRAKCSTAPVAGTYPGVLWLLALTPMANFRPGCRQVERSQAQTGRQAAQQKERKEGKGESSDILQRRSGTQAETALANRYKRCRSLLRDTPAKKPRLFFFRWQAELAFFWQAEVAAELHTRSPGTGEGGDWWS